MMGGKKFQYLSNLMEFGYTERHSRQALEKTGDEVHLALEWLLDNPEMPEPAPAPAPRPAPAPAPAKSSAKVDNGSRKPSTAPVQTSRGGSDGGNARQANKAAEAVERPQNGRQQPVAANRGRGRAVMKTANESAAGRGSSTNGRGGRGARGSRGNARGRNHSSPYSSSAASISAPAPAPAPAGPGSWAAIAKPKPQELLAPEIKQEPEDDDGPSWDNLDPIPLEEPVTVASSKGGNSFDAPLMPSANSRAAPVAAVQDEEPIMAEAGNFLKQQLGLGQPAPLGPSAIPDLDDGDDDDFQFGHSPPVEVEETPAPEPSRSANVQQPAQSDWLATPSSMMPSQPSQPPMQQQEQPPPPQPPQQPQRQQPPQLQQQQFNQQQHQQQQQQQQQQHFNQQQQQQQQQQFRMQQQYAQMPNMQTQFGERDMNPGAVDFSSMNGNGAFRSVQRM